MLAHRCINVKNGSGLRDHPIRISPFDIRNLETVFPAGF